MEGSFVGIISLDSGGTGFGLVRPVPVTPSPPPGVQNPPYFASARAQKRVPYLAHIFAPPLHICAASRIWQFQVTTEEADASWDCTLPPVRHPSLLRVRQTGLAPATCAPCTALLYPAADGLAVSCVVIRILSNDVPDHQPGMGYLRPRQSLGMRLGNPSHAAAAGDFLAGGIDSLGRLGHLIITQSVQLRSQCQSFSRAVLQYLAPLCCGLGTPAAPRQAS